MSKKEPKLVGPRREKNIVNRFFRVHTKVIARLLRMHRASTIGLLGLSLVLLSAEYIELKMLEYTTNSVSDNDECCALCFYTFYTVHIVELLARLYHL